mmetsp:Transcript_29307/g.67241  ORF Transcript_29307/g.67241 Transcript_29307/m.67241 type:complete len:341 (-) Transcript_29307:16-1038(-)
MMCWLYAGIALLALAWLARWLLRPDAVPTVRAPPSGTDYTQRPGLSGMMPLYAPVTGKRYLVVGGSGSVGLRILEALVERGEKHVTSYDVAPPRRRLAGATFLLGDVTDYAAVRAACENVDVVFATFALIRPHERLSCLYAQSHAVNVVGTENVVRACVEAEVGVLVQTSTSNVCVSPSLVKPVMDENSPFVDPSNTANHYSWTKAQAERAVLRAHGTPLFKSSGGGLGALATASIRPCSALFGPEDVNIAERWLRSGPVVTCGTATIDWVFVDDVVWAHLLCERRLHEEPRRVGGQAYCVSQDEPASFEQIVAYTKFFYERVRHFFFFSFLSHPTVYFY